MGHIPLKKFVHDHNILTFIILKELKVSILLLVNKSNVRLTDLMSSVLVKHFFSKFHLIIITRGSNPLFPCYKI